MPLRCRTSRSSNGTATRWRVFGGRRVVPAGVAVSNPAFDVTPARLVTAIITDAGIATRPYGPALQAAARPGR